MGYYEFKESDALELPGLPESRPNREGTNSSSYTVHIAMEERTGTSIRFQSI